MKTSIYCPYCGTENTKTPKIACKGCDLTIVVNEKESSIYMATKLVILCQEQIEGGEKEIR